MQALNDTPIVLIAPVIPANVPESQAREFWLSVRKSLLEQVDAIERLLAVNPRTAEIRQQARSLQRGIRAD